MKKSFWCWKQIDGFSVLFLKQYSWSCTILQCAPVQAPLTFMSYASHDLYFKCPCWKWLSEIQYQKENTFFVVRQIWNGITTRPDLYILQIPSKTKLIIFALLLCSCWYLVSAFSLLVVFYNNWDLSENEVRFSFFLGGYCYWWN
jgi:hypothetical protein